MSSQSQARAVSGATVKNRMRKGMSYEEAKAARSDGKVADLRPFVPSARSMAMRRLGHVRQSLRSVDKVLVKRPRDVKAKARRERIEGELAFLESLFEPT